MLYSSFFQVGVLEVTYVLRLILVQFIAHIFNIHQQEALTTLIFETFTSHP